MKFSALIPFALLEALALCQNVPSLQPGGPWQGVVVDREPAADGAFWARGHRYKMRFAEAGAGYMPLFGPHVLANPLLTFELEGHPARAIRLRDDGCDIERGAVVERWHLTSEQAEQTFELAAAPEAGRLRLTVESSLPEFAFRKADATGIRFAAAALGEVLYTPAFAVAADGTRTPLATTWRQGAIEIAVPADARYPMLIDPVVSTLPIAVGEPGNDFGPEVAYDASSARWIVVWQQRLSAFDSDVLFRRYSTTGALLGTGSAETSGAIAAAPSVGNCDSSDNFFVAWTEALGSIKGRRITANTGGMGTVVTVYDGIVSAPASSVSVGGSRRSGFLVAYTIDNIATLPVVVVAAVPAQSGASNSVAVYTGAFCTAARVSTATGDPEHWIVAGHFTAPSCLSGVGRFAVIDANLNILTGPNAIIGTLSSGDTGFSAASNGTDVVILWKRQVLNSQRIYAQTMRRVSGGYVVTNPPLDLSALEPGTSASASYHSVQVACDGARFAYAYKEDGVAAPRFATFGVDNGSITFYEGHGSVGGTGLEKSVSGIASQGESGGPASRFLLVSQMDSGSNLNDLEGTFLDAFQIGPRVTMLQTGCHPRGIAEPVVTTVGDSLLGSTLTVQAAGTVGTPFMLVGLPLAQPIALCSSLPVGTCRQGLQLPALATTFGAQIAVTIPLHVSYVGMSFAVQCVDGLVGGCPASRFGAAFAVSDTVQFTVR